jgi:hypothetical protein
VFESVFGLRNRFVGHDAAGFDSRNAIAVRSDFVVVCDKHNSPPGPVQSLEDCHNLHRRTGIKISGRLIGK